MPKFFVSESSLNDSFAGDKVCLNEHAEHIRRVLRYEEGKVITVCDGKGFDYSVSLLKEDENGNLWGQILAKIPSTSEPNVKITLVQALPKLDKMELILQKGTEIGTSSFVPILSERCVSRPDEKSFQNKKQRWDKIIESAAYQSGRGCIPSLLSLTSLKEFFASKNDYDLILFLYENEVKRTLKSVLQTNPSALKIAIMIGPEGGWSDKEVSYILNNGALTVGLGERILRTETAGFVALSQCLYHYEG